MIVPYFGELLISPIPLECSGNWCTHACQVCFANLSSPYRRADVKKIFRLLADFESRDTLEARLLQERRPIVLSNKTDPFATSNYQGTLPLLETLTALSIPVAFQTRGGRGIAEALSIVGPSVWYISVNCMDESIREQTEPHAPSIASRFDLMETLRAAGHRVVLGLNPLVPEWMPGADVETCLTRALACGAEGAWIERLHLNPRQIANMPASGRTAVTEPIIARAQKRRGLSDEEHSAIFGAYETCMSLGLPFFSIGQPFRSDFFAPYHEAYPGVTFPTLQDWVNHCHDTPGMEDRAIAFDEFADFLCPRFPSGVLGIDSYLGSTAHDLWHTHEIPTRMTYRQLLAILWKTPKAHGCPARYPSFAYAGLDDGAGGWTQVCTPDGMPLMVFSAAGHDEWWAPVEIEKEAA